MTDGRIVCFGELLLRLEAPNHELLLQSPRFEVHVGGAEANVAIGIAHLGHSSALVSVVPDNPLGRAARAAVRAANVDVAAVSSGPGRIGLYFMTRGAGARASSVLYDREGSAFATAPPGTFEWDALLANAALLHLSGITPALSDSAAGHVREAIESANRCGIPVSFDGNFRPALWAGRAGDAAAVLQPIFEGIDLLFGNHRDLALVLGCGFRGEGVERRAAAAVAGFAAFPRLKMIASTARETVSADHYRIAARINTREAFVQTDAIDVTGVVDRVGTGDAFVAGVLHGWLQGAPIAAMAETGLALAALKHSLPGDFSRFKVQDIADYQLGAGDIRR